MPLGNIRLFAAATTVAFLDRVFDHFTGFAGELLNPANQFFLLAFGIAEIIVCKLGPFLFQLALGDVPVAFDFKCVHISLFCFCFMRQDGGKVYLFSCEPRFATAYGPPLK